jgi:diaminopimelate epimerase
MTQLPFLKMHGAGNDFIVIDNREGTFSLSKEQIQTLAQRRLGVGCDQLVMIEKPHNGGDIFMRLFNQDGGEIGACGNAARCIGWWYMEQSGSTKAEIETASGTVSSSRSEDGRIRVDMGEPRLAAGDIPLSENRNTEHLGIAEGDLMDPMAVNMGNPHMIFFVRDVSKVNMGKAGPKMEHHPLFPQGANVSAVQVVNPQYVKQVVWERGAGLTLACGTAACAAVVAGVKRGLLAKRVTVELPGGERDIHWRDDNQVEMTGPVAVVFEGVATI